MNWNKRAFNKGFTLIEIIIVITIISLFIGFAVPKVVELLFNSNLKKTTRNVAVIIKEMRIDAILNNKQLDIVFDMDNGSIRYPDPNNDLKKIKTLSLSNVRLSIKTQNTELINGAYRLKILQNGMASPCSIRVSNNKGVYEIIVKPFILDAGIHSGT